MECKDALLHSGNALKTRFNRYIVECKDGSNIKLFLGLKDLIDTLWNVKVLF